MAFGVFLHRSDSIYDDTPAERYQFPKQYLSRAKACVGGWIVYLEPKKVAGTRGYFAIAKVKELAADPSSAGMYFAVIEPGTYLEFARPVPFSDSTGELIERGILNEAGRISGRAQSAVRGLSASDFNRIVQLGLGIVEAPLPRTDEALVLDIEEGAEEFVLDEPRDRILQVTSRPYRDRVFRQIVLRAYGERCAMTGLRLINGGGRAEVEAAHIRPVGSDGPDSVNNGIALSGTAHWMFDRGLLSLDDDLNILISRQVNDADSVRGFLNPSGQAFPPSDSRARPHPRFLAWHRENCFKS